MGHYFAEDFGGEEGKVLGVAWLDFLHVDGEGGGRRAWYFGGIEDYVLAFFVWEGVAEFGLTDLIEWVFVC